MPSGIKKVFATPLNLVSTEAKEELGTIRFEGNNVYKYVMLKNITATVAVAVGDPVAYRADEYDVNHVVADLTDADAIPLNAGCVQGIAAGVAGTAYYLWIKIRGLQVLVSALGGSAALGEEVGLLSTDKTATRRLYAGTTPNIVPTVGRLGFVKHVANKEVILDCVW